MCPDRKPWLPTFSLISCEHAGREVPASYERIFRDHEQTLESHRGYDIGALGVALRIASRIAAPIVFSTVTRLLVDLNRSTDQPDLFSEFTVGLSADEKQKILADFYEPHREAVGRTVASAVNAGHRVLHLGVHSCTDALHGARRDLDIAFLFDEARACEGDIARRFRASLMRDAPDLRYLFNEPYKGSDDGLTTTLRQRFKPENYFGIEIEVRQGMVLQPSEQQTTGDLLSNAYLNLMNTPPVSSRTDKGEP